MYAPCIAHLAREKVNHGTLHRELADSQRVPSKGTGGGANFYFADIGICVLVTLLQRIGRLVQRNCGTIIIRAFGVLAKDWQVASHHGNFNDKRWRVTSATVRVVYWPFLSQFRGLGPADVIHPLREDLGGLGIAFQNNLLPCRNLMLL